MPSKAAKAITTPREIFLIRVGGQIELSRREAAYLVYKQLEYTAGNWAKRGPQEGVRIAAQAIREADMLLEFLDTLLYVHLAEMVRLCVPDNGVLSHWQLVCLDKLTTGVWSCDEKRQELILLYLLGNCEQELMAAYEKLDADRKAREDRAKKSQLEIALGVVVQTGLYEIRSIETGEVIGGPFGRKGRKKSNAILGRTVNNEEL